jgi:hypothetical protein
MKKTLLILSAILLSSFTYNVIEKEFTIKFSETEINKHWQKLEAIKQIVNESNLPHQQVVFIDKSIDSLQMTISAQIQKQIKDGNRPRNR